MSDFICQKYTDCSSCSHYQKQIFKYRSFPKGMMIPKERCSQNTIYFLISGSVRVTSDEHPDTVFHDGQFIMQPIGSRVEFHILESTECILYLFETPQNICTDRFNKGLELAKESPMLPVVMDMCFPLRLFINGLKMYLNNELLCVEFLKAKQTELYFLLNCYYTLKEIAYFMHLYIGIAKHSATLSCKLPESERCRVFCSIRRIQHYHLPAFIQRYVRRACLPMDDQKEMPGYTKRPDNHECKHIRDLL